MRYTNAATMRLVFPIAALLASVGCTFVQQYDLPGDAGSADAGSADAGSCASPSDPNNCGACGHSCLGGACVDGACRAIVLADGQGDSSWAGYTNDIGDPLDGPDRVAADDAFVYWLNLRGEVMRVPVAGGAPAHVARTEPAPAWIALDGDFVYFSTLAGGVFRVAKTGGAPEKLAGGPAPAATFNLGEPYPTELLVHDGTLYVASRDGILACPLTGCPAAPVVVDASTPGGATSTSAFPFSFAIDASGHRYASEQDDYPTSSTSWTVEYTLTDFRDGQWLGLASQTAYYELHGGDHEVYALATADFGATGVVKWTANAVSFLASGDAVPPMPRGLAVDDAAVYWANAPANSVRASERLASVVRCKKTGCATPEVLAAGQIVPRAVTTTKDAVFWTTGDGRVMKLAKPTDTAVVAR